MVKFTPNPRPMRYTTDDPISGLNSKALSYISLTHYDA